METQASKILKVDKADAEQWLSIAHKTLAEGGVVAFPTETVYGLAADIRNDKGLCKLNFLKKRSPEKPYTVHISKPADMKRFVPKPFWFAQILSKKAWPGPVTLVIELDEQQIDDCKSKFGKYFDRIYHKNSVGLRCPAHLAAQALFDDSDMIIAGPSANPAGAKPAYSAEEVFEYFGHDVDVIIDAGTVKYQKPSTVVKITKKSYEILREGVIDKRTIDKLTSFNIIFVCTGNTCRSPMAEGWGKKLIAEYIGCDESELESRYKVNISSAGTFAGFGAPASELAISVMQSYGIDISGHSSQPINLQKLLEADIIYVMTAGHKDFINTLAPQVSDKVKLIRTGGVHDPIGGTREEYARSCEMIKNAIEQEIKELFQ